MNQLFNQYKNIFSNPYRLKNELSEIFADETLYSLNLESIIDHFIKNELTEVFPESYKMFVLIATIPSTSVSCERDFSTLKRIYTYSRNSMSQNRMSSLALLSIEKELFNILYSQDDFMDIIIERFASQKERRINLIYKV